MNTLQAILARSNFGFVIQRAADRHLYESTFTGTLIITDWARGQIVPVTA